MEKISNSLQKYFLQCQTKKGFLSFWGVGVERPTNKKKKKSHQTQQQTKQKFELLNCYHQFISGLVEKIHS